MVDGKDVDGLRSVVEKEDAVADRLLEREEG